MAPYKDVDSLEHHCFMVLAVTIHKFGVKLEESNPDPERQIATTKTISSMISMLPSFIVENIIIKVIETIHQSVGQKRRAVGLITCLEVLLLPQIQRLDLSGLFYNMRLPGSINEGIRNITLERVQSMKNLTILNMVSKCSDEILTKVSENCKELCDVNVSISDKVTDLGIETLVNGCKKLQRLGIYKCWEITPEAIQFVLLHAAFIKELLSDQLGAVLSRLRHSKKAEGKMFRLTYFDQTQALFEPCLEEIEWIGKMCPNIEFAKLYVEDERLLALPRIGDLKSLEVEMSAGLGKGFSAAITGLAHSLTTLQLNCECVNYCHIMLVGEQCRNLSTLRITTGTIEDDQALRNNGQYFQSLVDLHLQVWKEAAVSRECIEYFMMWCKHLEAVCIKAEMEFMTDDYLRSVLATNPLTCSRRIDLASDEHVPLTAVSVYYLLDTCPALQALTVSSWNVTEDEFFQLRNYTRSHNLQVTVH
ncbi:uncharacterized protein LOC143039483 [Oratosquilla oratoria]|uniref:uncharacterized protein LOC143039483 n=1 Tax=Oratosquilla oratoria TaxID=337810 RepID=UPI003F758154